jgi:thiosulfate reductase cytochrome b subunit
MVTGLTLAFDDELGISKEVKEIIKDVHYYIMYSIITFIIAHISGLTKAEVTNSNKGIVSGMIHGNPSK